MSSIGDRLRWRKATERALDQSRKTNRSPVFEIVPYDLNADRQAGPRSIDWRYRGRHARQRCYSRPSQLIEIGKRLSVNVDLSWVRLGKAMWGMIVQKRRRRHRRAEDHVPFAKQVAPLSPQPGACSVGFKPIVMAQNRAPQTEGGKAVVVGWQRGHCRRHFALIRGRLPLGVKVTSIGM